VTDISMPKMNGIETVRKIRGALPGIKCIFHTMQDGNGYRTEARAVGNAGYVLKSSAREELARAVRQASEGGVTRSNARYNLV
jgi:DNA-binding NarL/FixJ family response regulator